MNSITSQGSLGSFSNSGYSASEVSQMRRMSGLIPTFMAENEDHDPEEDSPRGLFGYNPRTGSFTLENVKQRELRPRSPSVLGLGNVEVEGLETPSPTLPGGGGLEQQDAPSDLV